MNSLMVWYYDHIGCRVFNFKHFFGRGQRTRVYVERALKKVLLIEGLLPEAINIYSWRRLWLPIKMQITMASQGDCMLGFIAKYFEEISKESTIIGANNYHFACYRRNCEMYVIDRADDVDQRKVHALISPESEVTQ